jgi:hypothetical protein
MPSLSSVAVGFLDAAAQRRAEVTHDASKARVLCVSCLEHRFESHDSFLKHGLFGLLQLSHQRRVEPVSSSVSTLRVL